MVKMLLNASEEPRLLGRESTKQIDRGCQIVISASFLTGGRFEATRAFGISLVDDGIKKPNEEILKASKPNQNYDSARS
jgi:hypothetical protein